MKALEPTSYKEYLCFEMFTEQEADTFCMEDYYDVGCGGGGGGG